MRTPGSKAGAVSTGAGRRPTPASRPDGSAATTPPAASSAPGTAQRRDRRSNAAQTSTIGAAASGESAAKRTGARQTLSSTPASIALARGAGIAAIRRPSGCHRPAAARSTPVTANAPTAAGQPPSTAPADTSSAAPGVDHAMVTGFRSAIASQMVSSPIPIETASSPEAASAPLAPTAVSPARTTAKAPPHATIAATTPATTRWEVRSGRVRRRLQHGGEQSGEARVQVLPAQRVQPGGAALALVDHARLAKDLEVMGASRLRHGQVEAPARGLLARDRERGDDPQAHGIAERVQHRGELDLPAGGLGDAVLVLYDDHRTICYGTRTIVQGGPDDRTNHRLTPHRRLRRPVHPRALRAARAGPRGRRHGPRARRLRAADRLNCGWVGR